MSRRNLQRTGEPLPLLSTRTVLSFATTDTVQNAWDPNERHPCADPSGRTQQEPPYSRTGPDLRFLQ